MDVVSARVPSDDKTLFISKAESNGTTPGKVIAEFVRMYNRGDQPSKSGYLDVLSYAHFVTLLIWNAKDLEMAIYNLQAIMNPEGPIKEQHEEHKATLMEIERVLYRHNMLTIDEILLNDSILEQGEESEKEDELEGYDQLDLKDELKRLESLKEAATTTKEHTRITERQNKVLYRLVEV